MSYKIAYVFPGQGAQFQGMGKDFHDSFDVSKNVYSTANTVLSKDISGICFEGSEEDLKKTINTQPCIVATEIAMFEALNKELNTTPSALAGHSLGEYSAMYCAGVLNLEDTFKAIQKRAESMSKINNGKMTAVISNDINLINKCIEEAKTSGIVSVANYNSLKQVVITGENEAVDKAVEILLSNGIKKVIPLAVSGAFHSELMKNASKDFETVLNKITVNNAKIPVYTNVDAKPETKADNFKIKMPEQIYSSVLWTQTVQNMVKDGITTFIEIGPGRVLNGLIKKTEPEALVYNVNSVETLHDTVKSIKENLLIL